MYLIHLVGRWEVEVSVCIFFLFFFFWGGGGVKRVMSHELCPKKEEIGMNHSAQTEAGWR